MFRKYNIEEMKVEEMDIVESLKSIDDELENVKNIMKEINEDLSEYITELEGYKTEFGGETLIGWCNANNPESFVGFIFVRANKIIDVVEYQ